MASVDGQMMRQVLLEVIAELEKRGEGYFQAPNVLRQAASRLGLKSKEEQQALLTLWSDLFREGHIAWGADLANSQPPFLHVTERGRTLLRHLSRDPANPDGYLAYLKESAKLNPIAESYIKEALRTYNSGCAKATAVMVGASSESLILELRDALASRMDKLGHSIPAKLRDWRISRVIAALRAELGRKSGDMPAALREAFDAHWPSFVQQIRSGRNEAGHPVSIEPVTQETVHASLLIFPELARMSNELKDWISSQYS